MHVWLGSTGIFEHMSTMYLFFVCFKLLIRYPVLSKYLSLESNLFCQGTEETSIS